MAWIVRVAPALTVGVNGPVYWTDVPLLYTGVVPSVVYQICRPGVVVRQLIDTSGIPFGYFPPQGMMVGSSGWQFPIVACAVPTDPAVPAISPALAATDWPVIVSTHLSALWLAVATVNVPLCADTELPAMTTFIPAKIGWVTVSKVTVRVMFGAEPLLVIL